MRINKEGSRTDHAEERLQFCSFNEILHTGTVLNLLCVLLLFSTLCKGSILATTLHWSVDTRQAKMCVCVCVCVCVCGKTGLKYWHMSVFCWKA
jgi:hypothetical protein